MTEQNHKHKDTQHAIRNTQYDNELDTAGKAMSEALRISFIILKVIMVVLVIVFLASGFRTVGSDEQALVLRFGKIHGIGEDRILKPGLHWVFPYPIDEIVKIPVEKKINLPVNSFWYYQDPKKMLPEGLKDRTPPTPTLNPIRDGYCITRSEKQSRNVAASTGSDYNFVHCKWQLTYQIGDPERFFRNVYIDIENLEAGQNYGDVIVKNVTSLLQRLVEDSVVAAMVNYTIDEAISSKYTIPEHVKKLLQEKLDGIESGVTVVSIQLTNIIWPRQVDAAFWASIRASQTGQRTISEAKGYAENTLNEAAGPVAAELLAALDDEAISEQQKELLWSQLAGAAQERIAEARAYRTRVVETARANADYLKEILPEYRKRPKLVIQRIYLDAIQHVLANADEKIIIQPAEGTKGTEIRVLLSRDPAIKRKSEQQK